MLQSPLCMPHEWSFLEEHRLTTNRGNGVSNKHQYLLVQTLTFSFTNYTCAPGGTHWGNHLAEKTGAD